MSPEQLKPPPEMLAAGRGGVVLGEPVRLQLDQPGSSSMMKTVLVQAVLNNQGQVTDAEVSAASDRTLVDSALTAAKRFQLNGPNEVYLTIRFLPRAE